MKASKLVKRVILNDLFIYLYITSFPDNWRWVDLLR